VSKIIFSFHCCLLICLFFFFSIHQNTQKKGGCQRSWMVFEHCGMEVSFTPNKDSRLMLLMNSNNTFHLALYLMENCGNLLFVVFFSVCSISFQKSIFLLFSLSLIVCGVTHSQFPPFLFLFFEGLEGECLISATRM